MCMIWKIFLILWWLRPSTLYSHQPFTRCVLVFFNIQRFKLKCRPYAVFLFFQMINICFIQVFCDGSSQPPYKPINPTPNTFFSVCLSYTVLSNSQKNHVFKNLEFFLILLQCVLEVKQFCILTKGKLHCSCIENSHQRHQKSFASQKMQKKELQAKHNKDPSILAA